MRENSHQSLAASRQKKRFKKSILISLAGHLTVFGIFSFSFGTGILRLNSARVSFLGAVLNNSDLIHPARNAFSAKNTSYNAELLPLYKQKAEFKTVNPELIKPVSKPPFNIEKVTGQGPLKNNIFYIPPALLKNKPVVMLYPRLPYQFNIYFKDRQAAHIEVIFNSVPIGRSIVNLVKRKISSGDLEADLLSMRYISHYLFIQRPRMRIDEWQSVKIDLSAKNK